MRSSPKLRPGLWDAAVAALVAALAILSAAVLWTSAPAGEGTEVVVSVDGTEQDRFAPEDAGTRTYENNGYTLRLAVENGEVWVAQADCPTQDCVHTGHIRRPGQSIVCLPARIVIRLESSGGSRGDVDLEIG